MTNAYLLSFGIKLLRKSVYCSASRYLSKMRILEEVTLMCHAKKLAPDLTTEAYKGQAGKIGIVGGSLEYTGAPYFAAISALKIGADLVHIFCATAAAPVIKSYSPELIVHPLLDTSNAIQKMKPWIERMHVLLIGPGLGREPHVINVVSQLINVCRELEKPLVIDADGLFVITQNRELIRDYPGVILTPNAMEFSRLVGADVSDTLEIDSLQLQLEQFGKLCVVVRKGKIDEIYDGEFKANCTYSGSGRRCGGQGDLLSGALAVFYTWALQFIEKNQTLATDERIIVLSACYAACRLTRECNAKAFKRQGRSMMCSDMIEEIGEVFSKNFES